MRDNSYTDPSAIRGQYQSRGRNRKLNMANTESLGLNTSQVASGGSGVSVDSGLASGGQIIADPTLTADPGTTFSGGTYTETRYDSTVVTTAGEE